jgi:hypothetical protein
MNTAMIIYVVSENEKCRHYREVAATLSKLNIVAQHESVAFESVKF